MQVSWIAGQNVHPFMDKMQCPAFFADTVLSFFIVKIYMFEVLVTFSHIWNFKTALIVFIMADMVD